MASAYLHGLKKTDLSELAAASKLPDYESLKKADLESALDDHLRANQTTYADDKVLADYYKRLGSRSPVKKETAVTSGDEAPTKKARRKTIKASEDAAAAVSSAAEQASSKVSSYLKTPSRQSFARVTEQLPASPAAVSDMVERQTTRLRSQLSHVYEQSRVREGVDQTRATLSSAYAVQLVFLVLEAYQLFTNPEVVPWKSIFNVPTGGNEVSIPFPDLFQLLKKEFWGPVTLWAVTGHILPTIGAYFFNIAHSAAASGRKAPPKAQQVVDPLVYHIVKAIVVIAVYYQNFLLFGWTNLETIQTVKDSQKLGTDGGATTMIASSIIGAILSVYEAILKK